MVKKMNPPRPRGWVPILCAVLAEGFALVALMREPQVPRAISSLRPVPYVISKETTWITEPLRSDGTVDYVAALNARLSEGVTPENNAAVLLVEVMGAEEIQPEIREEFYKQLGVPLPENTQGMLKPFDDFVDRYLETVESPDKEKLREELSDQFDEAWERPWTQTEFPILAQWLNENKQAIELILAATQRPRLHFPNVLRNEDETIWHSQISMIIALRKLGKTLCVHAMYSIGQAQTEAACSDAIACHRLATWGCAISADYYQMGIAIGTYERRIALALAESSETTQAQLAKLRRDLAAEPLPTSAAEAYDLFVRFTLLDWARQVETAAQAVEYGEGWEMPQAQFWSRFGEMGLDIGVVLRTINSQCSAMVEALGQPNYLGRKAAYDRIVQEFQAFREKSLDANEVANVVPERRPAQEVVSTQFAYEFWSFLGGLSYATETKSHMRRQVTLLGLALAEYHRDFGNYPERLDALVPKYLDEVPQDAFTLKPLIYRPREDGYLVYSLGPDGQDDNGAEFSPDGELDDVSIRMPIEREM
jgi:hypothetical protein